MVKTAKFSLGRSGCFWNKGIMRQYWPIPVAMWCKGLRVQIPPGAWMSVPCECCMLSGRGLCVGLSTRPEESY
jgi:hypothetical protein